jgi:hypothetical protein
VVSILQRFVDWLKRGREPEPHHDFEAWIITAGHCLECGWRGMVKVGELDPAYNRQQQTVDMAMCPQCGKQAVCSD